MIMPTEAPSRCPFHKALAKLRVFAGLPVPHSVKWIDGKPDFRQIDPEKMLEVAAKKLCAVCGQPLGEKCYWIGGPQSYQSHLFTDLPMHRVCAEESMRLCPFLNRTRSTYRGELPDMPFHDNTARPEVMLLMEAKTKHLHLAKVNGYLSFHAGPSLFKVKQF